MAAADPTRTRLALTTRNARRIFPRLAELT
jgi:hypothetical protein